ncbi:MAG: VacJ family lipoprotein [Thermodesulfobacteriota bacterium]
MIRKGWLIAMLGMLLMANTCSYAAQPKDPFQDEDLDFLEEEEKEPPAPSIADPLEPWNRVMFQFNDKLYFWVLKPVAQGYKAVTPDLVREGIRNFFHNLSGPLRAVNCFFQGKMADSADEMARFVYNSTFGIAGFLDLAKENPKLNPPEEDFGQTLGVMGLDHGFFITWPLLGPSSLRDTFGKGGDWFLTPTSYIDHTWTQIGVDGLDTINNTSFRLGDYEALKSAAIDPYVSFRNAYIQYREKQLNDAGRP